MLTTAFNDSPCAGELVRVLRVACTLLDFDNLSSARRIITAARCISAPMGSLCGSWRQTERQQRSELEQPARQDHPDEPGVRFLFRRLLIGLDLLHRSRQSIDRHTVCCRRQLAGRSEAVTRRQSVLPRARCRERRQDRPQWRRVPQMTQQPANRTVSVCTRIRPCPTQPGLCRVPSRSPTAARRRRMSGIAST
jgi:hypothetical protein